MEHVCVGRSAAGDYIGCSGVKRSRLAKRSYRLYRKIKLDVRMLGRLKQELGTRALLGIPADQKQSSSPRIESELFCRGSSFGGITVVDAFTRECLALIVDTSHSKGRWHVNLLV